MTRRSQFEESLKELSSEIIHMGERVEKAIHLSVQSLITGDLTSAHIVISQDYEINALEEKIDNIGSTLIATQQPVAKDLRRILISFKIASDLERMADLAVDVAKSAVRLGENHTLKLITDITKMAELAEQMTNESIRAFTEENIDLAYKMAKMDDEVDSLHSKIMHELFTHIANDPQSVNKAILVGFVSRYLERIADHATNIGESVVYLVRGKRPDLNQ
ncbi:MAG: phosphate signaling complex protein PhoU [Paenibacillaceae bacterium]